MEGTRIQFNLRGIGSILAEKTLAVPIYQRPYSWTSEEIREFVADLRTEFAQPSPEYFLGTIVLTKQGAQGVPPRDSIIDGQQRLASTCMLLAAIRDEFKARGDAKRAVIVQNGYVAAADLETAVEVSRLKLNSEDAIFFEARVVRSEPGPAPTRPSHLLLLGAMEAFAAEVKKIADDAGPEWAKRLHDWVAFLKERVKVIALEVPSDADAYLIFETLNDRGADLTIADLLKNYLFGRAGGNLDAVRDAWMMVLGALDLSSENSVFTTFLRHYWSSRRGAIRERELYKSIKENVVSEAQVLGFITDLQAAAGHYSALMNSGHEFWDDLGGTVKENVETLLRLDLEQNRPLLLAALQHFPDDEKRRLLRALVSWSVRGLIVGGIGGGVAEKAYCGAAVKIRSGSIKNTAELLADIAIIVPNDAEFQEAVTNLQVPKAGLARYYLRALERGKGGESEPEFVPNSNEEEVNLEHVLPKKATAADWGAQFTADERRIFALRLGNLCLLQKGPNGRIGNKPFSVKKPILAKSSFALTSEVGAAADWTKETILKRQKSLAALAVKVWPR